MATLTLSGGAGRFGWTISGLSWWFDRDSYIRAGVCTSPVADGQSETPAGIVACEAALEPGSTDQSQISARGYVSPGTYELYGFTQTPEGLFWGAGSASVAVSAADVSLPLWLWDSSNGAATAAQTEQFYRVLSGELPVNFFHTDVWNDLVDKVADMRLAMGLGWDTNPGGIPYLPQSDCYVSADSPLTAEIYNAVRFQVGSIRGTQIPDRASGDEVFGYHIERLVRVLNDIIYDI